MGAHTHRDVINPFSLLNPLLDSFASNSLLSLVLYLDSAYSLLPLNSTHFRSLAPPPGTVLLVLVPDIFRGYSVHAVRAFLDPPHRVLVHCVFAVYTIALCTHSFTRLSLADVS